MKLNGLVGKGTGKLGSSVFAVSGGEQIVRQYNPNVSNPSTDAQVEQRAKLKLMSQVAAVLAPIIAFAKMGLVSARNRFISANIGAVEFGNNQAVLNLNGLDLTGSSASIPAFTFDEETQGTVDVHLVLAAPADVDAVLYALIRENQDKKIELDDVKISTTPGEARTFASQLQYESRWANSPKSIYAYGIKYTNASSRQRYDNYVANMEEDAANLDVVIKDFLSGASFTKTLYLAM